uniref:Antitoxin Phd_YefM, type II toxin-antitoxin system n=1 Tax=Candidatus Kentrum sp. LFY TaxID=2126342 RepID=A0A450UKT3_9GAMM|nr:MAG: hypothetical protein BECKLFY1418B_GA0070995_104215 [Candidatus Kentron sp. LFY]VFJ95672.1 MAG: hypothetical protein BECKLFY1418A_GA0070994_105212 [Candidatus Kentron sp. LFY]VFK18638.1 MAG: hypothetical protein BECKLFY1418C_GA0070996_104617 [Candidatus Kentron sp. LFY]
MELHPHVIEKSNRDTFSLLPFEEYEASAEQIQDHEDLMDLRKAKEDAKGQKAIPLEEAVAEIGI